MKPVIYNGTIAKDYFVTEEGDVYSTKRKNIKKLTPSLVGGGYPAVTLCINSKSFTVMVHRLVAEVFLKFKRPAAIPKADWDVTPDSVKEYMKLQGVVNHINHNKEDSRASNLEYVTSQENSQKYHEHRTRKNV